MAGYGNLPSPSPKNTPQRSIFLSPRLFASKGITDSESLLSPTSILDTKPFSAFRNPFYWSDSKPTKPKPRSNWDKLRDSIGIGLAIVDVDDNDKSTPNFSIFGSQLKIQIPPADFGIKTRNAQVGPRRRSGSRSPPGCISASEMELSEDYTRVISYGPNPKTTHIFEDCIVESKVVGFPAVGNKSCSSESFLSSCCSCKKSLLGYGKDIYMYRGEKGFCSSECRYKMIMLEEEAEKKKVKMEVDDDDDDDLFW